MGLVHAKLTLINSDDLAFFRRGKLKKEKVREVLVTMLVDSGVYMMAINEVLKEQLGLVVVDKRKAQLADGSVQEFEIVGPIDVRFSKQKSNL